MYSCNGSMPGLISPLATPASSTVRITSTNDRLHIAQPFRALQIGRAQHVLAGQQRDDLRMLLAVIELEFHQRPDGFKRREMGEIEFTFRLAHGGVGPLQHSDVELFLGAEIVVQHALVGGGLLGNDVDARAGKPLVENSISAAASNALPGSFGIAYRLERRLCFCRWRWPLRLRRHRDSHHDTAFVKERFVKNRFNRCERIGRALAAMIAASPIDFRAENARVHLFQRRRNVRPKLHLAENVASRGRCPARSRSVRGGRLRYAETPRAR